LGQQFLEPLFYGTFLGLQGVVIASKKADSLFAIMGGVWYALACKMGMMGRWSAREQQGPPWAPFVSEPSMSVISRLPPAI
jgi:hypothetical protein